jgi:hypothetical protein
MAKKKIDLFGKKDEFYSYGPYGAIKQNYSWLEMTKKKYSLLGKVWRIGLTILLVLVMLSLAFLSNKYGN